jgi:hypothetical protein
MAWNFGEHDTLIDAGEHSGALSSRCVFTDANC